LRAFRAVFVRWGGPGCVEEVTAPPYVPRRPADDVVRIAREGNSRSGPARGSLPW